MSHECQSILHAPNGRLLCQLRTWPHDRGAFASGGPTVVCFERGDDAADEAGRLGGAADAGGVDSGEYAALGGDVGAGFDEDAVLSAPALPEAYREVLCDECFGALARTDSSCLQVQETEQEGFGGATNYRDYRRSVESCGFHPVAVAASDGHARYACGEGALGGSERSERPGKTLPGLRREQENDSARVYRCSGSSLERHRCGIWRERLRPARADCCYCYCLPVRRRIKSASAWR